MTFVEQTVADFRDVERRWEGMGDAGFEDDGYEPDVYWDDEDEA